MSEENNNLGNEQETVQTPPAETVAPEESKKKGKAKGKKAKKKSKLPIILLILLLLIAGGGAAYYFLYLGNSLDLSFLFGPGDEIPGAIRARYDGGHNAYVNFANGKLLIIDDNVQYASATPDRTKAIYITKDNDLYVINSDKTDKTRITEKVEDVIYIDGQGILYSKNDGGTQYYRYMFSSSNNVKLGNIEDYSVSRKNFHIAYAADGAVYELLSNSEDPEKLGNYDSDCDLLSISDDGKTVFWNDKTSSEHNVYMYANGDKNKVGTFDGLDKYSYSYTASNKSQSYTVVYNTGKDELFVIEKGKEPLKVKLGNDLGNSTLYAPSGLLSEDKSGSFSGLYVLVDSGNGEENLYYIDKAGEREKVMSDIGEFEIYNNGIYYVDEDDNLRYAKLNKESMSAETKVAGDVSFFATNVVNGYLYFVKDFSSNESKGVLYVTKNGADPKKISADVDANMYYSLGYINGSVSTDGKTIYYYKEPTVIGDTGMRYGELYKYTYGSNDSDKISNDILINTVTSGYKSGRINRNSLIFQRYGSGKTEEDMESQWCFYNGNNISVLLDGKILSSPSDSN